MASKWAIQLAATAWCQEETRHIPMDVQLAFAFAEILDRFQPSESDKILLHKILNEEGVSVDAAKQIVERFLSLRSV